ncbi:hypothetical protein [Emticicia sp. W12TSBA100-4]|uniref:hypothetical protein n=1 Tax=Emticicia sp. W12TSBA100-4 TaxID=3160965 RepID=UPI0033059583
MKNVVTKKETISKNQKEILEIISKADNVKTESLFVNFEGDLKSKNELKELLLKDSDDPEKKHEIYYKGIERLLKRMIPSRNAKFKEIKEFVREEKNIYLTRGKEKGQNGRRNADPRMAYLTDMETVFNTLIDCYSINATPMQIFQEFEKLNIDKNYKKAAV